MRKKNLVPVLVITALFSMFFFTCEKEETIIKETIENNDTTGNSIDTTITDIDGNIYKTVKIGNQIWMAENLKTTTYPNGTSIPIVTDDTTWASLADNNTDDAYCWYNDDIANKGTYGALYTWAAAMGDNAASSTSNPSGVQGVCPDGWHLPSDAEWTELEDHITSDGFSGTEGTALKIVSGWSSNGNGTDNYGFSALPGGYRVSSDGSFYFQSYYGLWWSSTEYGSSIAYGRGLWYDEAYLPRYGGNKSRGFSVRCLRD